METMQPTEASGLVVRATGSWYEVASGGRTLRCRIRGRLRLKGIRSTNPVVVGDVVRFEEGEEGEGSIFAVEPRRNYIIRRASNLSKESHIIAANVDQALLLVTLSEPVTAPEFVDRFLVTCEAYKVPVTLVLAGRTTLFSGNSGVGKSTLVQAIDPSLDIRTGEISESHHKGRHTTTFSTMYPLGDGGWLIDTPGIKGFGLIDIDDAELWHYFPEMMRLAPGCRFYNCTHTHEPGCAVVAAVERGEVALSRYESYLKILDEDDKYRK